MANISLSSSIIAKSSIIQKQSKFAFPIKFPFIFNIQNLTDNINESAALNSVSNITGRLISVIPISGNTLAISNIEGNISGILTLSTLGLKGTSTIGLVNFKNQMAFIAQILSLSNLSAQNTNNISINGQLISTTSLIAQNTNQIMIIGQSISASIIGGVVTSKAGLNGTVTATSILNSQVTIKMYAVVQVINATSAVTCIPTAIFKLVTNIIANTSIASTSSIQTVFNGNSVSVSNLNGDLNNLIDSSMSSESSMVLPEIFEFPWTFPFVIKDKVTSSLAISSNITNTTSITNNSICDLLVANITSNSNIAGTVTCDCSKQSSVIASAVISSNVSSKLDLSGSLVSTATITCSVIAKNDIKVNINASSALLAENVLNTINLLAGIHTDSTITGNPYMLIGGSLNVSGNIILPEIFNFPLTFPLVFINDITKRLLVSASPTTATSLITAYICSAISSIINSASAINGTSKNSIQLKSSIISETNIAASSFTGLIPLSGNVQIKSTINGELISSSQLNVNIHCTTLIPNIGISTKTVEIYETNITKKIIIATHIKDTLDPINIFVTSIFNTEILQSENVANNLKIKCIFCCDQNSNVQMYNKNKTVSIMNNLTGKVEFDSFITSYSTMNLFTICNVEFKKNSNVKSFKEE